MSMKKIIKITQADHVSSYFRQETWSLALVTVSGIFYNVGLLAGPWFEGQLAQCLLDIFKDKKELRDMLILACAYVLITAFVQFMRYIKRFYVRRFANNVNRNMKHILYYNLVHRGKSEIEQENVGSLMTKAISDVDACAEGMRKFTTEVFDTGVALLGYVVMLFIYDWRLALISCAFPPIAYVIAEKMKKVVHHYTAAYKKSAGRLNGAALDRVSHAVTYRVFGCEQERNQAFQENLDDYMGSAIRANIWTSVMQPVYHVIAMTGAIMILWFGARNVMQIGWASWDIAAFTTFLACFIKLAVKSSKAGKLFNAVQKAQVSWRRIKPLLKDTEDETEIPDVEIGEIEAENLSQQNSAGVKILDQITFSARPGEIIGITGAVASGKSMLGKAFLCEMPYSGSVRFHGMEMSDVPEEMRSGIIGYMGHQPELMSDTIEQNILLGDSDDAGKYLKLVCMDEEVLAMPDGENTLVGSGGVRLSGGQQARLALARTLCHKKPILILDDPFSAVDQKTEREIFAHLQKYAKDCVILLMSHRLALFPQMNQVIWMEEGKASVSNHEKLMAENVQYRELYLAQQKEAKTDEKA